MADIERLSRALKAADAAGDTEAATRIARAIRQAQAPAGTAANPAAVLPSPPPIVAEAGSGFNRGLAGTIDLATRPVTEALQYFGVPIPDRPLTALGENRGMIWQPSTPARSVIQRGSSALGAAAIPGSAPLAMARTGTALSAPVVRAAASSPAAFAGTEAAGALMSEAGAAAGEAVGGTPGAFIGGVLGGALAPTAAATTRGVARGGESGRRRLAENIETFKTAGIQPTAAQATQSPLTMMIEKSLAVTPGGYAARYPRLAAQADQAAERVRRSVTELGGDVAPDTAGRGIERGLRGFVDQGKARASRLYGAVDSAIPDGHTVDTTNLRRVVSDIMGRAPETADVARAVSSDRMAAIAAAVENMPQSVPYQAARELRTRIGSVLGDPQIMSDMPRADMKRLYGAIADDLTASLAGNPEALRAQRTADRWYRAFLDRVDERIVPMIDRGNRSAQKIFEAFERQAKDPAELARLKRSMPEEEWNTAAGVVVDRLGRARASAQDEAGSVFSPETFLTEWNKIPERSRRLLLGTKASRDMNALAKAAAKIRDEREFLFNPSGTAPATAAGTMAGAVFLSPFLGGPGATAAAAGALGSQAATYAAERLFMSPRFVNWLAQSTRVPIAQVPAHIDRLARYAESMDPSTRDAVVGYIDSLTFPAESTQTAPASEATPSASVPQTSALTAQP